MESLRYIPRIKYTYIQSFMRIDLLVVEKIVF